VFVRTTVGGNLAATAGAFPGGPVFGVAVDPANENIVYAIGNASVFQSVDGGANWTDITGNIHADGAGTFRAIANIPSATGDRLAVGTNAGVRVSGAGSFGTWFELGTGLPNAPVWDLDYDATDDVLVAGTLGRGAWTIANVSTLGPLRVAIDIKPGGFPNSINPRSNGVIPVAILTTATFDATTVDPLSVKFGPNGATEAHERGHIEDVDGDGDLDLVLHFRTQETGIRCGDTSASLTGQTFDGQAIQGSDSIRTVGCR